MIKLRWVMVVTIVSGMLLTLIGQPESFWSNPTTARWADGQLVHTTNTPGFSLLLDHGALAFVAAHLVFLAAVFYAATRLPRLVALAAIFSTLFAYGYDATLWLVMCFHVAPGAAIALCGATLGTLLSFAVLPARQRPREAVNAWRWVMVAVLFVDFANTLLGQPSSYWQDPSTMLESNSLTRMFLGRGWMYYLLLDIMLAAGQFALITFLPVPIAFVTVFAFIFGNFVGASNWFLFEWRWGWVAPIVYGIILSTLMVLLAFRDREKTAVSASTPA
ncbi:MAG: hypothetical protein QM760_23370 [Nibricoccus sp.]